MIFPKQMESEYGKEMNKPKQIKSNEYM